MLLYFFIAFPFLCAIRLCCLCTCVHHHLPHFIFILSSSILCYAWHHTVSRKEALDIATALEHCFPGPPNRIMGAKCTLSQYPAKIMSWQGTWILIESLWKYTTAKYTCLWYNCCIVFHKKVMALSLYWIEIRWHQFPFQCALILVFQCLDGNLHKEFLELLEICFQLASLLKCLVLLCQSD